jgi:hypothetical protein
MASSIPSHNREETFSPKKITEPRPTNRGLVVTSTTEAVTVVKLKEAIQVAKWRPRKTPESST